jgi:hypothetical protein
MRDVYDKQQEEKEPNMTKRSTQAPNKTLSLGTLRPKDKTKEKSPDAAGTIRIKRDLILDLYKQLTQSDDDDVVADLAGWLYDDANGRYMRVQLSAKWQRPEYRDDSPFFDFH